MVATMEFRVTIDFQHIIYRACKRIDLTKMFLFYLFYAESISGVYLLYSG